MLSDSDAFSGKFVTGNPRRRCEACARNSFYYVNPMNIIGLQLSYWPNLWYCIKIQYPKCIDEFPDGAGSAGESKGRDMTAIRFNF